MLGGELWQSNLSWCERGWLSFLCGWCVLKDPHPWNPKEKEEQVNLTEEQKAKSDDKFAQRLAKVFLDESSWECTWASCG
eukprot:2602337-Pyramimonas_sp.AAC.1